jgi:hypothetical protein
VVGRISGFLCARSQLLRISSRAQNGAFCYNAVHIYAFGAASLAIGLMMPTPLLVVLGALWLAHSGFDRMLGYGLKSPDGFSFTHLGRIGKHP